MKLVKVKLKIKIIISRLFNCFFDEMLTYHHYMNIIIPNKDTCVLNSEVRQNDKDGE